MFLCEFGQASSAGSPSVLGILSNSSVQGHSVRCTPYPSADLSSRPCPVVVGARTTLPDATAALCSSVGPSQQCLGGVGRKPCPFSVCVSWELCHQPEQWPSASLIWNPLNFHSVWWAPRDSYNVIQLWEESACASELRDLSTSEGILGSLSAWSALNTVRSSKFNILGFHSLSSYPLVSLQTHIFLAVACSIIPILNVS